jgi:hypothetical protein
MTRHAALGLLLLLAPASAFAPVGPALETARAEGVSVHGPAASAALPALRAAPSDPSPDVRRFASNAIERIEGREPE